MSILETASTIVGGLIVILGIAYFVTVFEGYVHDHHELKIYRDDEEHSEE